VKVNKHILSASLYSVSFYAKIFVFVAKRQEDEEKPTLKKDLFL